MPIPSAKSATAPLQSWQPEGDFVVHEGDPQGRGFTVHEATDNGRTVGVYFFDSQPAKTSYELTEGNEIVYVIEGEVEISMDDGSKVALGAGDCCFLEQGKMTHWWFKTYVRELVILV